MSATLGDLQHLLDLGLAAGGPAVERLGERTVEGLAAAYLPRHLSQITDGMPAAEVAFLAQAFPVDVLDLTDPGTCHAALVALALSYGLDPGMMGLGVSLRVDGPGWRLEGVPRSLSERACVWFVRTEGIGGLEAGPTLYMEVRLIAAIPADQPAVALAAMVAHRLGGAA